jgi:hypothetical protein
MPTQPATQLIQWQDFKVKSEVDIVLEIAHQEGWKDCEIFGNGRMITQPQESTGWKLIPADLYEYSIPPEGVARVLQTINAGVRIQGVIIADDERRTAPPPKPARLKIFMQSLKTVGASIGKTLLRMIAAAAVLAVVLLGLYIAVRLILLAPLVCAGIALFGLICKGVSSTNYDYDPKLIILVDDGNGGTVWISLFTWYE